MSVKFLELEAAYLVISFFVLIVTTFVTTRSFMPKGAFKKGIIFVSLFLFTAIMSHYYFTTKRMSEVKTEFNNGGLILCESRATRKVAQSVRVSKGENWKIEGDVFTSALYTRVFHTARCILPLKGEK